MSYKYNPFTGQLDKTSCKSKDEASKLLGPYTTFFAGTLKQLAEETYYNAIDACSLPITSERQTIDLGTLDELCN